METFKEFHAQKPYVLQEDKISFLVWNSALLLHIKILHSPITSFSGSLLYRKWGTWYLKHVWNKRSDFLYWRENNTLEQHLVSLISFQSILLIINHFTQDKEVKILTINYSRYLVWAHCSDVLSKGQRAINFKKKTAEFHF